MTDKVETPNNSYWKSIIRKTDFSNKRKLDEVLEKGYKDLGHLDKKVFKHFFLLTLHR